jgi:ribose-phosphate pyrophosphokinase
MIMGSSGLPSKAESLGTIAPPECQMLSFLLLGHTLKKQGASRVTRILPYLAYSREDKVKLGHSLATACTGALLKASGFGEIWTVDPHSEQGQNAVSHGPRVPFSIHDISRMPERAGAE